MRVSFRLFGLNSSALTILGVVLGSISILAATLAAGIRFGPSGALTAGLLLALLPAHIGVSLSTHTSSLVPPLLLIGWWLGEHALREHGRTSLLYAIGSSAVVSLVMFVRYEAALFVGVAAFAWVWWAAGAKGRVRRPGFLLALIPVAVGTSYLVGCDWNSTGRFLDFLLNQSENAQPYPGNEGGGYFLAARDWFWALRHPHGILGTVAAGIGLLVAITRGPRLLVAVWVLPLGFLVHRAAVSTIPKWPAYIYPSLAVTTLLAALGITVVARKLRGDSPRALLVAGILSLLVVAGSWAEVLRTDASPYAEEVLPLLPLEYRPVFEMVEENLNFDGRLLAVSEESSLPFGDLLLHTRVGRVEPVQLVDDLREGRLSWSELQSRPTAPGDVAAFLLEPPRRSDLQETRDREVERFEATGWRLVSRQGWTLLLAPGS